MFEIYNYIAYFFTKRYFFDMKTEEQSSGRSSHSEQSKLCKMYKVGIESVCPHFMWTSEDDWKGETEEAGVEPVDKQTSCVLEIALSGDNALWQWGDSGKGQEQICCTRAKFPFPCGISHLLNRLHVESLERIRCIFSSYLLGISYLY